MRYRKLKIKTEREDRMFYFLNRQGLYERPYMPTEIVRTLAVLGQSVVFSWFYFVVLPAAPLGLLPYLFSVVTGSLTLTISIMYVFSTLRWLVAKIPILLLPGKFLFVPTVLGAAAGILAVAFAPKWVYQILTRNLMGVDLYIWIFIWLLFVALTAVSIEILNQELFAAGASGAPYKGNGDGFAAAAMLVYLATIMPIVLHQLPALGLV